MVLLIQSKQCGQCKVEKSADCFYCNKEKRDGLQNMCKNCTKANDGRRVADGRQKVKCREWYYRQRQSIDWVAKSRDRVRRWAAENLEKNRAINRDHYRRNKEEYIARANARRITLAGLEGSHTLGEWQQLCRLFGGVCLRCGSAGLLTRDHVIPVSSRGRDDITNIQPLCRRCNSSKGSRCVDYRTRDKVALSKLNAVGERLFGRESACRS